MSQQWQSGNFDEDEPARLFSDSGIHKVLTTSQTIKMDESQLKTMICKYLADNGIEIDGKTVGCSFLDRDSHIIDRIRLEIHIGSHKTIEDVPQETRAAGKR